MRVKDDIILARKMARIALIKKDAIMWASAHNLARGCFR